MRSCVVHSDAVASYFLRPRRTKVEAAHTLMQVSEGKILLIAKCFTTPESTVLVKFIRAKIKSLTPRWKCSLFAHVTPRFADLFSSDVSLSGQRPHWLPADFFN